MREIMRPSFLPLVLLILATSGSPASAAQKTPAPGTCEVGLPASRYSEQSLYHLDSTWASDTGRTLKLSALQQRPVVVALFFTSCTHSCPLIVADMKKIEAGLAPKARGKVTFLLVTIDPERDSAEVLRAFRKKHELPAERWTLLRGESRDVRELAANLGFNYVPGSATQFAHSLLITVLDRKGEVSFQQSGLGVDRTEAVVAVKKILAKN
jgi:protein SCO1/2